MRNRGEKKNDSAATPTKVVFATLSPFPVLAFVRESP